MAFNDSSTGGYLVPNSTPPLDDQALFRFVQQWLVGVLNGGTNPPLIPGTLFFPRWQLEPPNWPGPTVDWAALGIETTPAQEFPYITHVSSGGVEYDRYEMHEWVDVLVSLYGPNCNRNARQLRDGMYIPQNRAVLLDNDFNLTGTAEIRTAPSLDKSRWAYRVDFRVKLRRRIVRHYPILDLLAADVTVYTDVGLGPIPIIVGIEGTTESIENSDQVTAFASVISSGVVSEIEGSDNVTAIGS